MGEKTRKQQHLVRARCYLRLVLGDPVDLGLATKVIDRLFGAHQLEQPAPQALYPPGYFGTTLIEPENRRAQRRTLLVNMNDAAALGGHGHAADQAAVDVHLLPQQAEGLAEAGPVVLGVLLGPAWLAGEIGIQLDLALGEQVALSIEQQRPHALGAVVDAQQVAWFAQGVILLVMSPLSHLWERGRGRGWFVWRRVAGR